MASLSLSFSLSSASWEPIIALQAGNQPTLPSTSKPDLSSFSNSSPRFSFSPLPPRSRSSGFTLPSANCLPRMRYVSRYCRKGSTFRLLESGSTSSLTSVPFSSTFLGRWKEKKGKVIYIYTFGTLILLSFFSSLYYIQEFFSFLPFFFFGGFLSGKLEILERKQVRVNA